MKNYKQEGDVVTLTAPTGGVVGGTPVLIGGLLVVPAADVAETLPFEGRAEGVFSYTKIASQAWTEGQKIYWDTRAVGSGGQRFTTDPTQGPLVGVAVTAVGGGAGETTGVVRMNATASSLLEGGAEAAIADLVDNGGGAAANGTIEVVTAPAALTGAGGGTANGALEDEGILATAGGNTYSDAASNLVTGKIKNNVAELAVSQAADRVAIVALTDAVKELSAKLNTVLATLRLSGLISP